MNRLPFLAHFVLSLGIAGAGYFAWLRGVPQAIYAADQSMMTSVIAVGFLISVIALGALAWRRDLFALTLGHLMVRLSVMAAIVGTAVGLSLQAHSLIGGAAAFGPLATSLFTTATGGVAALLLEVLTFNLEAGLKPREV